MSEFLSTTFIPMRGVQPALPEELEEQSPRTRKPVPDFVQVDIVELITRELDLLRGLTEKSKRRIVRDQVERFVRTILHFDREEKIRFFQQVDASKSGERKLAEALGITGIGLMICVNSHHLAVVRTYKVGENGSTRIGLSGMVIHARSCEWYPTGERIFPLLEEEIDVKDGYLASFHQRVGDFIVEVPCTFRQCKYDRDRGSEERTDVCRTCRIPCPYRGY